MRIARIAAAAVCGATVLSLATPTLAQTFASRPEFEPQPLYAVANGAQEVPPIHTPAAGKLAIWLDDVSGEIRYELGWAGLRGRPARALLHFGQQGVNGGVLAVLCSNRSDVPFPATPPECGPDGARGVLGPEDVPGIEAQGVERGDVRALFQAIRQGAVYVNVHTTEFPNREIRGQLQRVRSIPVVTEDSLGGSESTDVQKSRLAR
jgi:hypothetical protein